MRNLFIGQRFRQIRKAKNLTQQAFSKALGISPNFMSDMERGKTPPSEPILLLLEFRFAINKTWLLTGEGEMYRQGERAPVDIKDIPVYNMKAWLDDYWKTAGEDEKTWLKVHFRKCFPDFENWLLKKERAAADDPPEASLKAG